jgi:hypothetical protein
MVDQVIVIDRGPITSIECASAVTQSREVRSESSYALRSFESGSPLWTTCFATRKSNGLRIKVKCCLGALGAAEGTRTPTVSPPHGPEPCASTNSATAAQGAQFYRKQEFCQRRSLPDQTPMHTPRALQRRVLRPLPARILRANQIRAGRAIRTTNAKPSATLIRCRAVS